MNNKKQIVFQSLIVFLSFFFSKISYCEENYETEFPSTDTSLPISVGFDLELGSARFRDALVMNMQKKESPALCNAYAFLVGNKTPRNPQNNANQTFMDQIMPSVFVGGVNLYTKVLIINRTLWEKFNGYPCLIINGFYRQLNLLKKPYMGNLYGIGLFLEIYKEYWKTSYIYPRFGLSYGLIKAPINSVTNKLKNSHPNQPTQITLKGKGTPNKIFNGHSIILDCGLCWSYKIYDDLKLNTKIMNQYMFSFPVGKRYIVTNNNRIFQIKKNIPKNSIPQKSYMFVNTISLQTGIEYSFSKSRTTFLKETIKEKKNKTEFGTLFFLRSINPYCLPEYEALFGKIENSYTQLNIPQSRSDKSINLSSSSPGFGIYGLYLFKSEFLQNIFNIKFLDDIFFILGCELIFFDQLQYNKAKKLQSSLTDTSKLSFLGGLSFFDDSLLSFRLIVGYDMVSSDYWGENVFKKLIGSFFLVPELKISFANKAILSFFTKLRSVPNISLSGGGGVLKTLGYDIMFFESGIKLALII